MYLIVHSLFPLPVAMVMKCSSLTFTLDEKSSLRDAAIHIPSTHVVVEQRLVARCIYSEGSRSVTQIEKKNNPKSTGPMRVSKVGSCLNVKATDQW